MVRRFAPSRDRRMALRQADGIPVNDDIHNAFVIKISDANPIASYYETNNVLLESFRKAFTEQRLDDAYVLGIRFATFSIDALPRHSQYRSKSHNALRLKNVDDIRDVLDKVELVASHMDDEELANVQNQMEKEAEEQLKQRVKEKKAAESIQQSAKAKLAALTMEDPTTVEKESSDNTHQNTTEENRMESILQESSKEKLAALAAPRGLPASSDVRQGPDDSVAKQGTKKISKAAAAAADKKELELFAQAAAEEDAQRAGANKAEDLLSLSSKQKDKPEKHDAPKATTRQLGGEASESETANKDLERAKSDARNMKLEDGDLARAQAAADAQAALDRLGAFVGTEAERLAREREIRLAEKLAHEEWETYKMLFREVQD